MREFWLPKIYQIIEYYSPYLVKNGLISKEDCEILHNEYTSYRKKDKVLGEQIIKLREGVIESDVDDKAFSFKIEFLKLLIRCGEWHLQEEVEKIQQDRIESIEKENEFIDRENQKERIINLYITYVRKHNLFDSTYSILDPIGVLQRDYDDPLEFKIELLKLLINCGEKHLQGELDEILAEIENKNNKSDSEAERTALEYKNISDEVEAELEGKFQLRKRIIVKFKEQENKVQAMVEIGSITKDEGHKLIESARKDAEHELKKIDNL